MRTVIVLLMMLLPLGCYAKIYKWSDKNGNVFFSDQPHKGARVVKIKDTQSYSESKPTASAQETTTPLDPFASRSYKVVSISQPSNELTIRNPQGMVSVSVHLEPALLSGDKIIIVLDGRAVGAPQATTSFNLTGLERGKHTIAVKIIDKNKKVLAQSDAVTVYMHQPRINMIPMIPKKKTKP